MGGDVMGKLIYISNRNEGVHMNKIINCTSSDLQQLLKVIIYFTCNSNNVTYKTKLNKLLFYSQFLFYKEFNKELMNLTFVKDYYGPVLKELDLYLHIFEQGGYLEVVDANFGKFIKPKIKLSNEIFNDQELEILARVLNKFKNYNSGAISDYSHNEVLWKKAEIKEEIKLGEAYLLNEF